MAKADLYTTAMHVKMVLRDGRMPPMTPLPEHVKVHIDPAFTIGGDGWGGLVEDEDKGLRCPVRGCGEWHHRLDTHAGHKHRALGGSAGLKALMSIPRGASLLSMRARERLQESGRHGMSRRVARGDRLWTKRRTRKPKAASLGGASRRTVGWQNTVGTCPAQTAHALMDLQSQIGRSPSRADAEAVLGVGTVKAILGHFGTWNNAKAQCGLAPLRRGVRGVRAHTREQVLEGLAAWHEVHGEMPSVREMARGDKAPRIPAAATIMKHFNTKSWPVAMRRAAIALGLTKSRYYPKWDDDQQSSAA